jgi:hypothetical protein
MGRRCRERGRSKRTQEEEQEEEGELDELAVEEQLEVEPGDDDYSLDSGDEDDEDLRPAKRRKPPPRPASQTVKPLCEHKAKFRLGQALATQLATDGA